LPGWLGAGVAIPFSSNSAKKAFTSSTEQRKELKTNEINLQAFIYFID
jgi:hypothetical protein